GALQLAVRVLTGGPLDDRPTIDRITTIHVILASGRRAAHNSFFAACCAPRASRGVSRPCGCSPGCGYLGVRAQNVIGDACGRAADAALGAHSELLDVPPGRRDAPVRAVGAVLAVYQAEVELRLGGESQVPEGSEVEVVIALDRHRQVQ